MRNRFAAVVIFGIMILISISCGFFSREESDVSNPDSDSSKMNSSKIVYGNGIEVETLANGMVLVNDRQVKYGLAFPEGWKAGPISEEFYQVVKDAAQIHPLLGIAYGSMLQNPDYQRVFAFDTSPEHLTNELFSLLTVASAFNQECINMPVTEMGDATINNLLSENPDMKISGTPQVGESQFGSPWFYFMTITETPELFDAYTGVAVSKTGNVCLKLTYMTNNKDIDIFSELEFTLDAIAGFE